MIHIGFHLHAYQPPTQRREVLDRIFQESYLPVIEVLENNDSAHLSLDIARSLGERLSVNFLDRIRALYNAGKIELVNTPAYHYLLPFVPDHILLRQLQLNEQFYQQYFMGPDDYLFGVFPPELACSPHTADSIKNAHYSWMMCDDEPCLFGRRHLSEHFRAPLNYIPLHNKTKMLLRSRMWSNHISHMREYSDGARFVRDLIEGQYQWSRAAGVDSDTYCILAVDFETFGHHHTNAIERFLIPFFKEIKKRDKECHLSTLTQISLIFLKQPVDNIFPQGSWSTSHADIARYIHYPLWNNPDNTFHRLWNEFMQLAFSAAERTDTESNPELTYLLDTAFYSCTPWQYSHGNYEIASWCLPAFSRIVDLLCPDRKSSRLYELWREMYLLFPRYT
ncbi:MAG: hypothetical protein U1A25_02010 [Candidatus Sungbacteria bacterium]|nr:hypothetical protein [bacterium]MDZ4260415.1 hypothetical protein [Candidatus Sungbacteria bacterium]